jgi:beta-glucanase (GH16 family)
MGATHPVNSRRTRAFASVSTGTAFLVLLLTSGFLAGPPSVTGQGVLNRSAERDLVGLPAESDADAVDLSRRNATSAQITGAGLQRVDTVPPHTTSDAPDRILTFDGRAGEAPDPRTWNHDLGGGGWGNQEAQTYTSSRANSRLDGRGGLLISAREGVPDAENGERSYTSARINTRGTFEVSPGSYVEASIRAPTGTGVWPAFWMLGANWDKVGWPSSGEIDIMEVRGSEPMVALAALHMAALDDGSKDVSVGSWHGVGHTDLDQPADERANRYGVYFDEKMVVAYVNRIPTLRYTAAAAEASGRTWPFGQAFFLILNVAVGGLEDPSGTSFPRTMRVGAVKVWSDGIPF